MLNDFRKATWADAGNQIFIIIASIILGGWIIRFNGGNPAEVFASYYRFFGDAEVFGLSLDLMAVMMICSISSFLALEGGVYNTASEGCFLLGILSASLCAGNTVSGGVVSILGVSFVVGGCAFGLLSFHSGKTPLAIAVRGLFFSFLMLLLGAQAVSYSSETLFFPVMKGISHPGSAIFLSIAIVFAVFYLLFYLQLGIRFRAGFFRLTTLEKAAFALLVGGVSSLGGASLFLLSPAVNDSFVPPWGIGLFGFAAAITARGRLWPMLPVVVFLYAVPLSTWNSGDWGDSSMSIMSAALILLLAIVPPATGKVEGR